MNITGTKKGTGTNIITHWASSFIQTPYCVRTYLSGVWILVHSSSVWTVEFSSYLRKVAWVRMNYHLVSCPKQATKKEDLRCPYPSASGQHSANIELRYLLMNTPNATIITKIIFYSSFLPATSWVLIRHLHVIQIETWCYHQGEERISIISVGIRKARKGIWPVEINKTAI